MPRLREVLYMRMRNPKDKDQVINSCTFFYTEEGFVKDQPIHLEIGMGKGDFIKQMAQNYPNINFIGVEKMTSILARAIQNLTPCHLPNVKVMRVDALELQQVFSCEISTIYLNFSDPWPKSRHAKRRLTSEIFLNIYDDIFKDTKTIIQKTDNVPLFESSIISLTNHGYKIEDISLDLHQTPKENYMTEYEKKFAKENIKINYLKATKK